MKMKKLLVFFLPTLFFVTGCAAEKAQPTEFTVVAYNLENVFDVDGVAIFDDYKQKKPVDLFTYTRFKLLTKLENAVSVLAGLDAGGPDVILFQEFENDFTPQSPVEDIDAFLSEFEHTTARKMLTDEWDPSYAGIPSVAWMAKVMADAGMTGYQVVVAPPKDIEEDIAHVNATFSRFPISQVFFHELLDARDVIETQLLVNGSSLWVYNNHWKSGASNPARETIRVENAKVLRGLVDARLGEDPKADIIIGGDLNSHYNHSRLFPRIKTGINSVLGSSGDERFSDGDLYNLWFEIPVEARYSEVWRGKRGTLMHLIVSRGLYDESGVSYVDSSFDKLLLPGLNTDQLGRPLEWNAAGKFGGGTSDHFPVFARFRIGAFEQSEEFSTGKDAPNFEIPLAYERQMDIKLPDGAFLVGLSDEEFSKHVGKMFSVDAAVEQLKPSKLRVNGRGIGAWIPDERVVSDLEKHVGKRSLRLVVKPGFWRGKRQFVVEGIL
jgi:endonuclease/exonuclease/phosphatase family metal-dependent hydrolase